MKLNLVQRLKVLSPEVTTVIIGTVQATAMTIEGFIHRVTHRVILLLTRHVTLTKILENCVDSLKEISMLVHETLLREAHATGTITTTSVALRQKGLAVQELETLDLVSSVVDVFMTTDLEVVEIGVRQM